jgi:hypothetical protein
MNETISSPAVSELVQLWFYTAFFVVATALMVVLWFSRNTQQRNERIMALLSVLEWRVIKARTLGDLQAINGELIKLRAINYAMDWDCYIKACHLSRNIQTKMDNIQQAEVID